MGQPMVMLGLAFTAIAALTIALAAVLRGWEGWLQIRRLELEGHREARSGGAPTARIELADLKERVRKLEAIATGVDY